MLILMVTSVGAVVLAGGAIIVRETQSSRQATIREMSSVADVVAGNSAAALGFEDAEAAARVLESLSARADVARAALLRPDGSVFVTYGRPGEAALASLPPLPDGASPGVGGRRALVRPGEARGERLGSLYLEFTMQALRARVVDIVLSVVVVVLLAGLFAYVVSSRLHRVVSEPIERLSSAAERVTEARDFSVRVEWSSGDELGVLTETFNRMLARIEQQERDLRVSEERLRHAQKMEAIGQLAGGVAHDFNNLLTVISGYATLLESRTPADDPRRNSVREILVAAERAAKLTRELLAFGRKQVLEPRRLDLREVVGGMEGMLRRLIDESIQIVVSLAPETPVVRADPNQIVQVVMNLVTNARDAMPSGGTITIEVAACELDPHYAATHPDARPGRHAVISVSDTGCGISPEIRPHVFEPFFATKGIGKGTGLGLASVYGIVKQSGGHVTFYTEAGIGTTFRLYLPADAGDVALPNAPPADEALGGDETILLVEDEPGVRELTRRVLTSRGYRVIACSSPEEALAVFESDCGSIHLVLTDVIMPGMNGREMVRRLEERCSRLRVLFMSGYTGQAIERHGVLEPGIDFIPKPFTPDSLAARVRRALDRQGGHAAA